MFDAEKALRTDEARLRKLAAFKIAASQRNGESIGVRAAGDLAENQIFSWKIGNHQSRPAVSAIGVRKRDDNDFAGYRFDHAESSSGEFQSRPRTDSLNSAPLNAAFSSESFAPSALTLRDSEISSPTLRIFSSNDSCASSRRISGFISWAASNYSDAECRPAMLCRSSPDQGFAQCARNLCACQRPRRWQ